MNLSRSEWTRFGVGQRINNKKIMKKIIHITLLIAGTSIGVGIVALPMVAVNLGLPLVTGLVALMLFIGYRSFMMPVDVNIRYRSF